MDERKAYRDRIDALLDELNRVVGQRDAANLRADLAEESSSYFEHELTECRDAKV